MSASVTAGRWPVGLALLASALAPLVALLAVLRADLLGWWLWVVLGLCVLSVLHVVVLLRVQRRWNAPPLELASARPADEQTLRFTASYLIPALIAVFGGEDRVTLGATLGVVALLAVVYVRGGLFHLNPVLTLLGWRIYDVTRAGSGEPLVLLTRRRHLAQDSVVAAVGLTDRLLMDRGGRDGA